MYFYDCLCLAMLLQVKFYIWIMGLVGWFGFYTLFYGNTYNNQ